MSRKVSRYRIYTQDGGILFEGTAMECCEKIGVCRSTFDTFVSRSKKDDYAGRFRILVIDSPTEKELNDEHKRMCKRWDEFVTPIREKYGVPVYRKKEMEAYRP